MSLAWKLQTVPNPNFVVSILKGSYVVLLLVHFNYEAFGVLNEDAKVDSMVPVIIKKKCNLGMDGTCNNETFNDRPRCGFKDKVLPLPAKPMTKGYTKGITLYMYLGVVQCEIIERAFDLWSKHANIT